MKQLRWIFGFCTLVIYVLFTITHLVDAKAAASPADSVFCSGLDYQEDTCLCHPDKHSEKCNCNNCNGGPQSQCITKVRNSSGNITGTISVVRTKVKTKGSKSGKDVVVYLKKVADNNFPLSLKKQKMDQKALIFIPHVMAVQKGTTIEFLNNDNDNHNVYFINDKSGTKNDMGTWQPGESRSQAFDQHLEIRKTVGAEGDPDTMIVLCKLHLEMAAYVVLFDNPFFSLTQIDGDSQKASYAIKNVPPGKYELSIWHKKLKLKGLTKSVTVEQNKNTILDLEITKKKYAKAKG